MTSLALIVTRDLLRQTRESIVKRAEGIAAVERVSLRLETWNKAEAPRNCRGSDGMDRLHADDRGQASTGADDRRRRPISD